MNSSKFKKHFGWWLGVVISAIATIGSPFIAKNSNNFVHNGGFGVNLIGLINNINAPVDSTISSEQIANKKLTGKTSVKPSKAKDNKTDLPIKPYSEIHQKTYGNISPTIVSNGDVKIDIR